MKCYLFLAFCWVEAKNKKLLIAFPSDLDQTAQEEINYEFQHPDKKDNTIIANKLPYYPEQNPYEFYEDIKKDTVFGFNQDDPWQFFKDPLNNAIPIQETKDTFPLPERSHSSQNEKKDGIAETISKEDAIQVYPWEVEHSNPILDKQDSLSEPPDDIVEDNFIIDDLPTDRPEIITDDELETMENAEIQPEDDPLPKRNGSVQIQPGIKFRNPQVPTPTSHTIPTEPVLPTQKPKILPAEEKNEYLEQQKARTRNTYDYLYAPYDDPKIYDDIYQADEPLISKSGGYLGPNGHKPKKVYKPRDPYKEAVGAIEGCKFSYILRACLAEAAFYAALETPFNEDKFMQKAYFCAIIFKTKLCRYCSLRVGDSPFFAKRIQFGKHVINHWNCEESYKTVALEQIAFFLETLRPLLNKTKLRDILEHLPQMVMELMRESASCALEAFRYYSDHQRREYARYKISDKELSEQASYTFDDRGLDYATQVDDAHLYGYEFNDLYGNGYNNKGQYDPNFDWEHGYQYNGPIPYDETFNELYPVDHIIDNNFDKTESEEGTEPTMPADVDNDTIVTEADFLMESDTPTAKTKPVKITMGHIKIDLTNQEILLPAENRTKSVKLTDIDPKFQELSGAYHPDISRPFLPWMSPYSTYRKEYYVSQTQRHRLPHKDHHFLELNSKGSTCDLIEASVNPYDNCLGIDVCGLRCTFRAIPDCCWDKRRRCSLREMTECRVYGVRKGFDIPIQGFVRKQYLRTQKYFDPLHRYIHKSQAFGMCKFGFQRGYDVDGLCVGVAYQIKDLDSGKSYPVKLGGLINGLEEDQLDNPVDLNVYTCVEFKWHSPESACTLQRIRLEMKSYCCKVTEDFAHPQVEEMDVFSHEELPFFTTDHKISAYDWARNVKLYRNQKMAGLSVQGALVTVDGCESSLIVTEQVIDDVVQRTTKHQSFNVAEVMEDDYFFLAEKSFSFVFWPICYGTLVSVLVVIMQWAYRFI